MSPPKLGNEADCVLRFAKYWTNPLPTATLPRLSANAPTMSAVLEFARMPRVFIGDVKVSGAPASQEKMLDTSQPSTVRWIHPGALFKKARFVPNGNAHVPFPLNT